MSRKIYRVRDLIDAKHLIIGDGYRAKNVELSTLGIPFARVRNIYNGFHFDDADRFPEQDLHKVGDKISRPGDVVFTSKGTVGRLAFVRPETARFVYSPQLSYWRGLNPDVIDSHYLYYWLQSKEFLEQANGVKGQTDMADYVSLKEQRFMRITLPHVETQRAVARILGALDDKVELNRKMNLTLEALARALFNSWFVDFDPVLAKMEGRQPYGMDAETSALFPNRLVESQIGPVPEGWRVGTIGSEVKVVGGSTPSTAQPKYWEGGTINWITPRDLSNLINPVILDTERSITQAGLEEISSGLLPQGTVLMSSRAPIGYLAIAEIPVSVNQGFIAMICNGSLPNHYVLHWAKGNMEEIVSRSGGTTFGEISKTNFRPIPVIVPPREILGAYEQRAYILFSRLVLNLKETMTLISVHDTLLPKLLSGELSVKEADKAVESTS